MLRTAGAFVILSVAAGTIYGQTLQPARPASAPTVQRPPRDNTAQQSGSGRIRGIVVAADDGRPLRRVTIRASAPELREPRGAVTDTNGRYEITDLPAGRYTVIASRPPFVTISHGQTRPDQLGRLLDLKEGQSLDRIDFALPRGAVVTGRVLDEFGEPVPAANVQALRIRIVDGRREVGAPGSSFTTPDTGEFRLWGLPPGDYVVRASIQERGPIGAALDDRAGYAPTFYPGSISVDEAQSVRLGVGQTAMGLDVAMSPTRTSRISGTTLDSRGQPLRTGFVIALAANRAAAGPGSQPGRINPDGTFVIPRLTPGTYVLRASAPPVDGSRQPETLVATVTVTDGDVDGVLLTPLLPATVTGRIVLDPPDPSLEPSMIRVVAMPKAPASMVVGIGGNPPIIRDDFTFELQATPGDVMLQALPTAPGSDWMVKSVHLAGRDITTTGIELTSGAIIKDAEIVLTIQRQVISGAVTDGRGAAALNTTVFVFSHDRERWAPMARGTALTRPDQNGRYSIRGLPPGDYYAVALQYVDPARRSDPAYIDSLRPFAQTFSLREGESKVVDLRTSEPR